MHPRFGGPAFRLAADAEQGFLLLTDLGLPFCTMPLQQDADVRSFWEKWAGGSAVMYQAMTSLGFAAESGFTDFPKLGSAPRGASVLVLGAGIAGMVAALELRNAGYRVQVLEFNNRPGGRVWTLRGGDRYTELGGDTQDCGFAPGQYINPGPWRLPHHHHGILAYCRRLGVALENFVQVNYNALLHDPVAFGGKPQRLRAIKADYQGQVAELLAKATMCKQFSDAHTSTFAQATAAQYLKAGRMPATLAHVRTVYAERAQAMGDALRKELGDAIAFVQPQGGLFVWARLTGAGGKVADGNVFAKRAIDKGVAFVPGTPFFCANPDPATLRLSFATADVDKIREGVARLAQAL